MRVFSVVLFGVVRCDILLWHFWISRSAGMLITRHVVRSAQCKLTCSVSLPEMRHIRYHYRAVFCAALIPLMCDRNASVCTSERCTAPNHPCYCRSFCSETNVSRLHGKIKWSIGAPKQKFAIQAPLCAWLLQNHHRRQNIYLQ